MATGGYDVLGCTCVVQARNALQAIQFDVVVSDWDLGIGGIGGDVYELVKQLQPVLTSKFLFVSATQPRLDDYVPWLEKPVGTRKILDAIHDLIWPARPRRQTQRVGSRS